MCSSSATLLTDGYLGSLPSGLPHSDTSGSKLARQLPGIFRGLTSVLRRQHVPRHPPRALSRLSVLIHETFEIRAKSQSPYGNPLRLFLTVSSNGHRISYACNHVSCSACVIPSPDGVTLRVVEQKILRLPFTQFINTTHRRSCRIITVAHQTFHGRCRVRHVTMCLALLFSKTQADHSIRSSGQPGREPWIHVSLSTGS